MSQTLPQIQSRRMSYERERFNISLAQLQSRGCGGRGVRWREGGQLLILLGLCQQSRTANTK